MLVGLRGVGKTVLLDRVREDAEKTGIHAVRIEAPEARSLPALLAPKVRLAGFVTKFRVVLHDIEVGLDYDPTPGLADNGDLEHDLQALFEQVDMAAKAAKTAFIVLIDKLQYEAKPSLAALITAMHIIEQRALPVVLIGAGLPQMR